MTKPKTKGKNKPSTSTPQPTVPLGGPAPVTGPGGLRTRLGQNTEVHISSPTYFGGHLTFTRAADKEQYASACTRKIIPCKYIHGPTLDLLNFSDEVTKHLADISWTRYAAIILSAFTELT